MRLRHGFGEAAGVSVPVRRAPNYNPVADLGTDLLELWDARRNDLMTLGGGGEVSSWRGVKAASDASQPTGAAQPIWNATAFGGDSAVHFDAVDDVLTFPSPVGWPAGASPMEIWALVDNETPAADATARIVASYGNAASFNTVKLQRSSGTTFNRANFQGGNGAATASNATSNPDASGRVVMRGETTGALLFASCNWIRQTTGGAFSTDLIGTRFRIGASPATTPGGFWLGWVALVAVTLPLPPDKVSRFTSYLMERRRIR